MDIGKLAFFLATSHFENIFLLTGKIVWMLRPED
jgi:hypothetical protein